jgi:protocatechuate 3,4-dioxygenase beta subunit
MENLITMQLTKKLTPKSPGELDDDLPVGRVLSRREILALMAGASATVLLGGCAPQQSTSSTATTALATTAALTTAAVQTTAAPASPTAAATTAIQTTTATSATTAAATTATSATSAATTAASAALPTCVVVPELTEGPYFVDEKLNRSDVRMDTTTKAVKAGVPLRLVFNVSQVSSGACTTYAGAYVDIWHCDALGNYSDVQQNNTVGQNFLRGYQVTDANGKAEFTTIYPGWYQGRAVHIHFKLRNALDATKAHTFTSQLFFDDTLSQQVFAQAPYQSKGQSTTKNANDSIYRSGGPALLLKLVKEGDGYTATFDIGLSIA